MIIKKSMFESWPFKVDKLEMIEEGNHIIFIDNDGHQYTMIGQYPQKQILTIMNSTDFTTLDPIFDAFFNRDK